MLSTLFFYLSKIIWALVAPASLLYLLLLAGIVLLLLDRIQAARKLLVTAVALFSVVAFLPVGKWLVTPLEGHFPTNPELPGSVDGIIMLGGAVDALGSYSWDQAEIGDAADRYFAFVELAGKYPRARLLFTGGAGTIRDQAFKEADVALYLLESLGVDGRRLELERDSRNTEENAINSKALVKPAPDETWILVTSASHMPRAVGVFCMQGWPVIPYPVDHDSVPGVQLRIEFNPGDNLKSLNDSAREWVGLLAYFVTGKIPALLPGSCT